MNTYTIRNNKQTIGFDHTKSAPVKSLSDEEVEIVIIALQSETLSCKLNKRWEVLKLMEGFALGTMGISASLTFGPHLALL